MATEPRDLREADDDGFHEIQLSGKQLVFLCMATTVVSIVIFLCGVLVGRGVRPVEPVAEAAAVTSETPVTDPTPEPVNDPTPAPPAGDAAAPPPVSEPEPPASAPAATSAANTTKPPAEPAPAPKTPEPAKTPAPAPAKADPPPPAAKPASSTTPAAAAPSGGAIAVQVGALRERGDAEALARRLSGKGYAAYIVPPDAGAPNAVFKVRVGNYSSQDEAARVKRRLEQEEKLKPWIIR